MSKVPAIYNSTTASWYKKIMQAMRLRNFKEKTIKTYLYALKRYIKYTGKDPIKSKLTDILQYQEDIIAKKIVSFRGC